jgi:hypothetical protein
MRERWFGATGRKVPEIALEGTIDGALVLDDVSDVSTIHEAHHAGTLIVVRCASAATCTPLTLGGRARLSPTTLLDLDLAGMTYG